MGTENRVIAVLDWELSTLGNPLADFTYFLMSWVMPSSERNGLSALDLPSLGIPSVEQAVARYCELTNRTDGLPELDWYFAYNMFRLGAICQGIAGRVRDGTASSAHAQAMEARVPVLGDAALGFARKVGATG
jgi:aminoglycoside phosphotransferase (APT) family kinase protein